MREFVLAVAPDNGLQMLALRAVEFDAVAREQGDSDRVDEGPEPRVLILDFQQVLLVGGERFD